MTDHLRILKPFWRMLLLSAVVLAALPSQSTAQSETYIQTLSGSNLVANASCEVKDDKFQNESVDWNTITNLSVTDMITFEIRQDTALYYYGKPFTASVKLKIEYYTDPDQSTPTEMNNVGLTVRFDSTQGTPYPGTAMFKFKGAYRVKVTVNSITSAELGTPLPAIFRLKNEIFIERKYQFDGTNTDVTTYSLETGQLGVHWNPANYPGAETFDLEWTALDDSSAAAASIRNNFTSGGVITVPDDTLDGWFYHNATRINTSAFGYTINLPYNSGYVIYRVRGVQVDVNGVPQVTTWCYKALQGATQASAVVAITGMNDSLNWQYTGTFAEEGKRKEVVSYFDGTLRNRQSVTVNNTENKSIVQETIYDAMGRPAANVLPVPTTDSLLKYFPSFNQNTAGTAPYSYADLGQSSVCVTDAQAMSTSSGASEYYSANNPFPKTNEYFFNKYIPDAGGYPFSVTAYTADNTGRISRQGGVGPTFQLGAGHETRYYYGKPQQSELDRLFGSEAGNAQHFLKNMVVDPNGEISVSYVDANGKTVATALAGTAPDNLHPLAGADAAAVADTEDMVQPDNLVYNTGDYSITANSSFTVPVNGNYHFDYEVDPLSMNTIYGPNQSLEICSDCYYDLVITVTNDCGDVVGRETHDAGTVFDTLCAPPAITGNFSLANLAIGSYNVTYRLQISKAALDFYDDHFVRTNTDLKTLADFTREALKSADFGDCFADCKTCEASLGTRDEFAARFTGLFSQYNIFYDADYQGWINHLYDSLYAHCQSIACPGNTSVCNDNYEQMLADVAPGGQYALYDSTYQLLEPDINILQYYSTTTFTDENGNPASVENGQGVLVPPSQLTLKEFILNFDPAWADSLVTHHPEYCFYQWCLANSASKEYDDMILNDLQDAASASKAGLFDMDDYLKLFESDPFFQSTGLGYYLAGKMQDSMTYYSKTMGMPYDSRTALPTDLSIDFRDPQIPLYQASHAITFNQGFSSVANDDFKAIIIPGSQYKHSGYYDILGVAKWISTCGQLGMPIDSCVVCQQCINQDLVWNTYKNLYLQLKSRMYREAMANSDNPVFKNCTNCYIGTDGVAGFMAMQGKMDNMVKKWPVLEPLFASYNLMGSHPTGGPSPAGYGTPVTLGDVSTSAWNSKATPEDGASANVSRVAFFPDGIGGIATATEECPDSSNLTWEDLGSYNGCPHHYAVHCWVDHGDQNVYVTLQFAFGVGTTQGYNMDVTIYAGESTGYGCAYIDSYGTPTSIMVSNLSCGTSYCGNGNYTDTAGRSVHIEQGSVSVPPSNVPEGYGDCTFYTNYTGVSESTCAFNNVWVCTQQVDAEALPPSYCPDDPKAPLYVGKHRIYNDYFDFTDELNRLLSTDTTALKQEGINRFDSASKANIAYEADVWVSQLSGCTADTSLLGQLRRGMTAVAQAACDSAHPDGASTLPAGVTATADGRTYTSFDDVIKQVMGIDAVNDSCTSDLITSPYPYGQQASYTDVPVIKTDSSICAKLTALKGEWQTSGFSGSFHDFLRAHLGTDYTLSETQLTELEQSCTVCHYLIAEDMTLPAVFGPDATPPITCSDISTSLGELSAKYPELTDSDSRYATILTNFLNHKYGYSLAYYDYLNFKDSVCPVNSVATLYNQAAVQEVQIDDNSCVEEQFGMAVTNAAIAYQAYIDSVHRDFREGFLTKCMNVQPRMTMTSSLWEYQYTLYYYDQAGNLVETVPPKGVTLLSREQVDSVILYRKYGRKDCYLYSSYFNVNPLAGDSAYFQFDSDNRFYPGSNPFTMEMWVKLKDFSDQGLVNNYYHAGLVLGVDDAAFSFRIHGGHLEFYMTAGNYNTIVPDPDDLFSFVDTSFYLGDVTFSSKDISKYMQTGEWTQIVAERTGSSVQLYINGVPLSTTLVTNGDFSASSSVNPPTGAPLRIGAALNDDKTIMGLHDASIKQFRFYQRALSYSEIRQDLYSTCLTPSNPTALTVWAPLNDTTINDLAGGVTGEEVGDPSWFTLDQALWPMYPKHELMSRYVYNSLNETVQQKSPDGGTTRSWYDRLGRVFASQNSEQRHPVNGGASGRYSYTKYDALGRVIEVGEKSGAADLNTIDTKDSAAVSAWVASGTNSQAIFTRYDNPDPDNTTISQDQTNLRKRVAGTYHSEDGNIEDYGAATHYSYDISGNVKILWQDIPELESLDATAGLKRLDYDYDIISGKVNRLSYQQGKGDQFFYQYTYDADNRVIGASTSRDGLLWHQDASYRYYLHGPLARLELGTDKVQGVDYAYTLQGWLKGINSSFLGADKDMAGDGLSTSIYAPYARDVYGLTLGYYAGDYSPIGNTGATAFSLSYTAPSSLQTTGNSLYNGNISQSTLGLSLLNGALPVGYSYGYDQLNRIVGTRQHSITSGQSTWSNSNIIDDYKEDVAYDANGNILKYLRNGTTQGSNPLGMDSLTYYYNNKTNQLNVIHDSVPAGNYINDLDNQSTNNYTYDSIGNGIQDYSAGTSNIKWTVYGKIKQGSGLAGYTEYFRYDAGNNRIAREMQYNGQDNTLYYIRDAQGNTLATYNYDGSNLSWVEQDLYGSSRVGIWNWKQALPSRTMVPQSETDTLSDWYMLGTRSYELTNHLENVLGVISDKKIGVSSGGSVVDYYKAEVLSENDYYPFGMEEPVRGYNSGAYAYGFNGKRMETLDPYITDLYDYGMRMYYGKVGRFFTVDPLTRKYPELTPYQFASNTPIRAADLDGQESVIPTSGYSDPRKLLYEAGGDIATAFGNVADRFSAKVEGGWTAFKSLFSSNTTTVKLENTTKYSADISGNFSNYFSYIMQHNSNQEGPLPINFGFSKTEENAIVTEINKGKLSIIHKVSIDNLGVLKREATFSITVPIEDVPTKFSLLQAKSTEGETTTGFKVAPFISLFGNKAEVNAGLKIIQSEDNHEKVNFSTGGKIKVGGKSGIELFGSGALEYQNESSK